MINPKILKYINSIATIIWFFAPAAIADITERIRYANYPGLVVSHAWGEFDVFMGYIVSLFLLGIAAILGSTLEWIFPSQKGRLRYLVYAVLPLPFLIASVHALLSLMTIIHIDHGY